TIVATQIPLDRWHEQIGDATYADAILDRLVHNAYRLEMRGESMRRHAARQSADEEAVVDKVEE
ncbi:MAG: ATP-binding protein, partial [Rhodopila sp.]